MQILELNWLVEPRLEDIIRTLQERDSINALVGSVSFCRGDFESICRGGEGHHHCSVR